MENALRPLQLQKLEIGEVTSCDLSVNFLLAIGSRNVRILEWKVGLGFVDMFYSPLNFHKYGVTSVRFSPKGTMLASASLDGTAVLIDVITGNKIFTMVQYKTSNIKFCEFTNDCTKIITAADDGILCFWDLVHHCQIRNCCLHEDDYSLRGLAISPDSEYLLSVDSGNLVKLWLVGDVISKHPRCLLLKKNIHDDMLCCDFSPVKNIKIKVGSFLELHYFIATGGADSSVKIWTVTVEKGPDCETNLKNLKCDLKLIRVLIHYNDILSVKFNSRGNYIASTGLDNLVKLWEVQTGNCQKTLQGHKRYVTCAAFTKNSVLLATGSVDKTLIIWNLTEDLTLDSELMLPCSVSCHFTNIDIISSGSIVRSQTKKFNEFTVLQKLTFSSAISSIQFHGNEILVIAGGWVLHPILSQKTVEIWKKQRDKLTFEQEETFEDHECSINNLDLIPHGDKMILCSDDGMIIFRELNMKLSYKMRHLESTGNLKTCKFSPDSRFIAAAGDDQNVYLWDANNLEFMKVMQQHENSVTAVAFSPDSEFLASTCGSDLTLQSLKQEKLTNKFYNAHDLGVLCCDFSPKISETSCADLSSRSGTENNEKYLLATGGNDCLVKLWSVSSTKIFGTKVLSGHGGAVNFVKFSSAEFFILASCSSDATVRIWNTDQKNCLNILNYHKGAVTTCSFSKNSNLIATGSLDKTVLLFNLIEKPFHEPKEKEQTFNKVLENWTSSDTENWFLNIDRTEIAKKIQTKKINGKKLLSLSEDSIADLLGLKNEKEKRDFKFLLFTLKKSSCFPSHFLYKNKNVPHRFLCPITHQIMKDPVICTDGYTYDREAITEWFLSGNFISPITKALLTTTNLLPNSALKINIYKFLYENVSA